MVCADLHTNSFNDQWVYYGGNKRKRNPIREP